MSGPCPDAPQQALHVALRQALHLAPEQALGASPRSARSPHHGAICARAISARSPRHTEVGP